MDIKNKSVLVLGGWGLVGNAIIRKLLLHQPKKVIVTSLKKEEAIEACEYFRNENPNLPADYFVPWWGNIFVRNDFKDSDRSVLLNDSEKRNRLMADVLEELDEEILKNSAIYKLLEEHQPEILIDAINSATGIAYQDVYTTYRNIKSLIQQDAVKSDIVKATEQLLCTLYIPQLIRHIQVLYNSMQEFKTGIYVKIGTSGTGGMGLNIPYTHSEEKPSRVLLSKSSVAGAHTMLLFLMGRTPDSPIIKEIKPTAAIAWKRITFGEIKRRGKAIEIENVPFDSPFSLEGSLKLHIGSKFPKTGETLKSVFIDTGENGTFSRGEFEAITAQGQMEYVTPQEIADDVIFEIQGGNTGHDIINALDNATLEPTYRAGFMQHSAIEKLKELEEIHNVDSVAFELLGPPRLSKLLYEIHLIKKVIPILKEIPQTESVYLSKKITEIIQNDDKLRNQILSIGIPILLADGKNLLRGNEMKIPPFRGSNELEITEEKIILWAKDGWIDLRPCNIDKWKKRISDLIAEANSIRPEDTSSMHVRTKKYWNDFNEIELGKVVSWLFITEEKGLRGKA